MDREQIYDVLNTPPQDRRFWLAVEDFEEREIIRKWRDIQQCAEQDQGYNNKYRPSSVVLKLEHEI